MFLIKAAPGSQLTTFQGFKNVKNAPMVTESPTDVCVLPATLQLVTDSETVAELCCPDGLRAWNKPKSLEFISGDNFLYLHSECAALTVVLMHLSDPERSRGVEKVGAEGGRTTTIAAFEFIEEFRGLKNNELY